MSKFVEAMALLCFIYNVDFENFGQQQELRVRDDMRVKVGVVLTGSLYNVKWDWKNALAEYDLLVLDNMKDTAMILREGTKPRTFRYVFLSALQFALCCDALLLENLGRGRQWQRRPQRTRFWERGERESRVATGVWDREFYPPLCLCKWELPTKMTPKWAVRTSVVKKGHSILPAGCDLVGGDWSCKLRGPWKNWYRLHVVERRAKQYLAYHFWKKTLL